MMNFTIAQPTVEQIDEQVKLERDAITIGHKRLSDQTLKLENQTYGSATIYGISSIQSLLPRLISKINDTNSRIHERKNGVAFKDIHHYLKDLDSKPLLSLHVRLHSIKYSDIRMDVT